MWDVIILILDHCLSIYFAYQSSCGCAVWRPLKVSPYIHLMLLLFQSSGIICNHFSKFLSLDSLPFGPSFPFGIEGGMWDVIVLISDHCLYIYFKTLLRVLKSST